MMVKIVVITKFLMHLLLIYMEYENYISLNMIFQKVDTFSLTCPTPCELYAFEENIILINAFCCYNNDQALFSIIESQKAYL